jgi:hypothetical protein
MMNSSGIPAKHDGDHVEDSMEPVFYNCIYKGFCPGRAANCYDPDDLLDVSVPSDDEGGSRLLADMSPVAYYERNQRNIEILIAIEDWSEYLAFCRKMVADERVRKMKADRVLQLQSRAYAATQTEEEKTEFWRLHYKCVLEQGLKELAAKKSQLQPRVREATSHSDGDDNN